MPNNTESLPHTVGSLVRARERDWLASFSDDPEILNLLSLNLSESSACDVDVGVAQHSVKATEFSVTKPGTPAERKREIVSLSSPTK